MHSDDNTINDDDTNMKIKNVILSREETGKEIGRRTKREYK